MVIIAHVSGCNLIRFVNGLNLNGNGTRAHDFLGRP